MISNSVITPEPDDNISTFNFRRHINEYISGRNLLAFWLLGLCNNFGYVVMLSAAKDILEKSDETIDTGCIKNIKYIKCSTLSTGAVLLADILPSLLIKLFAPFTLHTIPFTLRHLLVLFFQITSYLLVAYSNTIFIGILGVVFASLGAGLGEITYLSLSSHFHNDVISYWSSGTGGAGIFGSLAFAALTDHSMLGLNSKQALLIMLIIPIILAFSYGILLKCPPTTHKIWLRWPSFNELNFNIFRRRRRRMGTTTTESFASSSGDDDDLQRLLHSGNILDERQTVLRKNAWTKIRMAKPLLRFMIPLALVYFSEYFINQGLLELLVFNCNNSFNLSPMQQYRWYQVFYQTGVFISRSSIKFFPIRSTLLPILAILQIINALLLFFESLNGLTHLPHILLLMLIIFYEGLLGGSAYVNTFSAIHRTVSKANREFCISFATISDSLGIVLAGFSSIYAHNFICKHRW
ncbi:Battenin [Meloidogyne graminicola]|uniref:Battenin n=1 Tax=Meloidogyne graminicola TaxID=189291 RepID=A0A8T0A175_9BILA|nr:Battenin [Meloidogyne graminicola]